MPKSQLVSIYPDGTGSIRVPTETYNAQNAARRYVKEVGARAPGTVYVWKRANSQVAEKVHFKKSPKGAEGLLIATKSQEIHSPIGSTPRRTTQRAIASTAPRTPGRAARSPAKRSPTKRTPASPKADEGRYAFRVTHNGQRHTVHINTLNAANAARRFYGRQGVTNIMGGDYHVTGHGLNQIWQVTGLTVNNLPIFERVY